MSTGKLEKDKQDISYRHRPSGDRVWSFSGKNADFYTSALNDLIYGTRVVEGTDDDPTRLQIFPSFSLFFAPLVRLHIRECFDWCKCNTLKSSLLHDTQTNNAVCRFFFFLSNFLCFFIIYTMVAVIYFDMVLVTDADEKGGDKGPAQAAEAHTLMESSQHVGKIMLDWTV